MPAFPPPKGKYLSSASSACSAVRHSLECIDTPDRGPPRALEGQERQAGASRQEIKAAILQGKADGLCWEHDSCANRREVYEWKPARGGFRGQGELNEAWEDGRIWTAWGRGGSLGMDQGEQSLRCGQWCSWFSLKTRQ